MTDSETNGYEVKIAVLETKLDSMKDNLRLQAGEYERRLTELNHSHARAAEDKNKFLLIETFQAKVAEYDKQFMDLGLWRSRVIGIALGSGFAGSVVGALIMRSILK